MQNRFDKAPLRQYHELVTTINRPAKMANVKKASAVVTEYASLKNFKAPAEVTEEASSFVMK